MANVKNTTQLEVRDPASLSIAQLMPHRPTIGDMSPVILWRLIRVVGLHKILGEETESVSYFTGKEIGKMLAPKSVEEFAKQLTDLKVGVISVPVNTPEEVHVAVAECITCDGIKPAIGKAICQLEAGLVAGALEQIYPGKQISGVETKCIGGLGDEVCLIECKIL